MNEKVVSHLNYQLDDLCIDGTYRFTLDDFISLNNSKHNNMPSTDAIDGIDGIDGVERVQRTLSQSTIHDISKFNKTIQILMTKLSTAHSDDLLHCVNCQIMADEFKTQLYV